MIATQQGLPGIRMIVVPHPLAGLPEAEVDKLAVTAALDTMVLLEGGPAA